MLNPKHSIWADYSPHCSDFVTTLITLQLHQNRPLLLSVIRSFDKKNAETALKLIVSWNVRNLITGTIPAGTLEREFSNQAKLISDSLIKTTVELRKSVESLIPTDQNFKDAFAIASVSKATLARYYLAEIEKTYQATKEKETSKNTELVNLEHILPEKPDFSKDWNNWNEDDHKSFVKRIGNLTLLDKIINSEQKSASFINKLKEYKKSEINITRNLLSFSKWDKESISSRQSEFADKAVKIWTLKL